MGRGAIWQKGGQKRRKKGANRAKFYQNTPCDEGRKNLESFWRDESQKYNKIEGDLPKQWW